MTGYLNQEEVSLIGGYKHPEKGLHVEVEGKSVPRKSVSAWEINFSNEVEADQAFQKIFGITYAEAQRKKLRNVIPHVTWGR